MPLSEWYQVIFKAWVSCFMQFYFRNKYCKIQLRAMKMGRSESYWPLWSDMYLTCHIRITVVRLVTLPARVS